MLYFATKPLTETQQELALRRPHNERMDIVVEVQREFGEAIVAAFPGVKVTQVMAVGVVLDIPAKEAAAIVEAIALRFGVTAFPNDP
jgi:hypothetical protein